MNVLGIGSNYIALAGKTTVFVKALPQTVSTNEGNGSAPETCGTSLDLPNITFPSEWIAKDGHIECIAISNDDKLVAVGDSMHGLYLFKLESTQKPEWLQVFCRSSNKRVVKLDFTSDNQFLTFLDKQGDIYAIRISEDHTQISNTKKIMGHTSFISDYVTRPRTKQIVSCDRDEKIRISNFPDAFVIQGFKLGHSESVINVTILNVEPSKDSETQRSFLLSVSLAGTLLLWDFDKPIDGTETDYLKSWNIKELLSEDMKESGVKQMKAVCIGEAVFVCVVFTGSTMIYIFRLSLSSLEINFLHRLETESENIALDWTSSMNNKGILIVYTPDLGSIRCWKSGYKTLQSDNYDSLDESVISDMKASTESAKVPVVPMKKRLVNFEDVAALNQEEQHIKMAKA